MEKIVRSLSWSKIYSWNTNKKQFIKTYFEKEPFFETKEIIFWKVLWKMIELAEYEDMDKICDECMKDWDWNIQEDPNKRSAIQKAFYNIIESDIVEKIQIDLAMELHEVYEYKLQTFIDQVCVIWYTDNTNKSLKALNEFKTWKTPWTQERVDNHGQLDLYCLLIHELKGYYPDIIKLYWLPTTENEKWDVITTWEIQVFEYKLNDEKIKRIEAMKNGWIQKIFMDIQEAQRIWEDQKFNENKEWLTIEQEIVELNDIVTTIKELKIREEELKEKISADMIKNSVEKLEAEWIWSAYFTERKSYEYPREIKMKEDELKKEKKEFEKTATPTITKSLTFKQKTLSSNE